MDNAAAEFDKHDMQLIEDARRESEAADAAALEAAQAAERAEAGGDGTAAPTPAPAAAPAPAPSPEPAPAPTEAAASAAAPAAAAPPPKPQGDPRAALRASRQAEKIARENAERVAAENAELRRKLEAAGVQVDAGKPTKPDDKTLADLEKYEPGVVQYLKAVEQQAAELQKQVPAAAPAAAFVPEYLPLEVQDHVDEVPELLEWQMNPDQTMWTAAKAADQLLQVSDKWAGKPLAERFAEAVRLVKANIGAGPSPTTKPQATLEDAQAAIARAASGAAPRVPTVGDLRGGATPDYQTTPDYSKMTDEEILNLPPI